jgi:hypothetical protein
MVAPNESSSKSKPVSSRKRAANRANARKSTGPRTPEGKARSSRNAISHGIYCQNLLLPGEDWTTRTAEPHRAAPGELFPPQSARAARAEGEGKAVRTVLPLPLWEWARVWGTRLE